MESDPQKLSNSITFNYSIALFLILSCPVHFVQIPLATDQCFRSELNTFPLRRITHSYKVLWFFRSHYF